MIEDTRTGQLVAADILPVDPEDIEFVTGWRFDWRAEVAEAEVFKLVGEVKPAEILGLMSVLRRQGYIEVRLLESAPGNVGRLKRWRGIAGNLLAFAAQLSFASGGEGFVLLVAKTELINHYQTLYGFVRHGHSQKMVLDTLAAMNLIKAFEKGPGDGNSPRTG